MRRFRNFLRRRAYLVLSIVTGVLIIIFSTVAAAHQDKSRGIEYHSYNENHLRVPSDHMPGDRGQEGYRLRKEKRYHKKVRKVEPPVPAPIPIPVPEPQPQPVPPIHIEPPIEIDPIPLPVPMPPCGGCGVHTMNSDIACPMHSGGASAMVCIL